MNIWKSASVDVQPTVELYRWWVAELPDGDRHFIGWCGEGRVTSKIMEYDSETKTGVTRSGRRYMLMGNTNHNMDADYVWACWRKINEVTEYKDVSAEY